MRLRGRRAECEFLDAALADALAGRSRAVVLRGEAGVGKSSLLDFVAERGSGWRTATAVGSRIGDGARLQRPAPALCADAGSPRSAAPPAARRALATVFGYEIGPAPDRFLVGLATLTLLAEVADQQPLLCVIDDAQWLDNASAQIVLFVARRLLAERIALVCAARTGIGDGVLGGLPALPVTGLGDSDARALLLENLPGPVDAAVCEQLLPESHGNPLALLELPRTWNSADLAGGFGLPARQPVVSKIEQSYREAASCSSRRDAAARPRRRRGAVGRSPSAAPCRRDPRPQPGGVRPCGGRGAPRRGRARRVRAPARALCRLPLGCGRRPSPRAPRPGGGHRSRAGPRPSRLASRPRDARRPMRTSPPSSSAPPDAPRLAAGSLRRRPSSSGRPPVAGLREAGTARAQGGGGQAAGRSAPSRLDTPRGRARRATRRARKRAGAAPQGSDRTRSVARSRGGAVPPGRSQAARIGRARRSHARRTSRRCEQQPSAVASTAKTCCCEPRKALAAHRLLRAPPQAADLLLDGLAIRFTDGYAASVPRSPAGTGGRSRRGRRREARRALAVDRPSDRRTRPVRRRDRACARHTQRATRARWGRTRSAPARARLSGNDAYGRRPFRCRRSRARRVRRDHGCHRRGTDRIRTIVTRRAPRRRGRVVQARRARRGEATERGEGAVLTFAEHAGAVLYNGLGRYDAAVSAAESAVGRDELGASVRSVPELVEAARAAGGTSWPTTRSDTSSTRPRRRGRSGRSASRRAHGRSSRRMRPRRTLYLEAIDRLGRCRIAPEQARAPPGLRRMAAPRRPPRRRP